MDDEDDEAEEEEEPKQQQHQRMRTEQRRENGRRKSQRTAQKRRTGPAAEEGIGQRQIGLIEQHRNNNWAHLLGRHGMNAGESGGTPVAQKQRKFTKRHFINAYCYCLLCLFCGEKRMKRVGREKKLSQQKAKKRGRKNDGRRKKRGGEKLR